MLSIHHRKIRCGEKPALGGLAALKAHWWGWSRLIASMKLSIVYRCIGWTIEDRIEGTRSLLVTLLQKRNLLVKVFLDGIM